LAAAIHDRKLTQLDRVLDVAIQFAWGLHAGHEHGVIHQHVKPANVLLTTDGIAKVTDFGLARARALASVAGKSASVAAAGLTPAYASPEQALGRSLTRKTDVWSWGVSVLEMFVGQVTWGSGTVADEVLEHYLETGPGDRRLPAMPPAL